MHQYPRSEGQRAQHRLLGQVQRAADLDTIDLRAEHGQRDGPARLVGADDLTTPRRRHGQLLQTGIAVTHTQ